MSCNCTFCDRSCLTAEAHDAVTRRRVHVVVIVMTALQRDAQLYPHGGLGLLNEGLYPGDHPAEGADKGLLSVSMVHDLAMGVAFVWVGTGLTSTSLTLKQCTCISLKLFIYILIRFFLPGGEV